MKSSSEIMNSPETRLAGQYVTFRVGELFFGVTVGQVQEVLRFQPMTPIPLAPPEVRGLVNLRGQIITAIDVRSLLKMDPAPTDRNPMNVVIQAEGEIVSLLVDSIGDVLEADLSDFEDTPHTIAGHIKAIVKGVFKLKDRLLLVLDGSACIQGEKIQ